jgi:hypothetical protein
MNLQIDFQWGNTFDLIEWYSSELYTNFDSLY